MPEQEPSQANLFSILKFCCIDLTKESMLGYLPSKMLNLAFSGAQE